MLTVGPLAFTLPWMLAFAVLLPLIWWLLRIMPPRPRRLSFPAIRLLFGLRPADETPEKTPPWLLLLRLALAILLILTFAGPVMNPGTPLEGTGPVIIAVDDGWASARHWPRRQQAMSELLDRAVRAERPVAIVTTAPDAADGGFRRVELLPAPKARVLATALTPKPWPTDRTAALNTLTELSLDEAADIFWLSDGIDTGDAESFASGLDSMGHVHMMADPNLDLARVLVPPESGREPLQVRATRAAPGAEENIWLRASGAGGALLLRERITFAKGLKTASADLVLAPEVRNQIERLEIEGERSAATTVLFDERWRRRPVGLVSGRPTDQPLISGAYYVARALEPYSEVRTGDLSELLRRPVAAIILDDVAKVLGDVRPALIDWLESGGVLIRFAGPRLAESVDDLVPIRLRRGDRILGGALSWSEPATLGTFDEHSPFSGLEIPEDVRIHRQVLAEPSVDLGSKAWARLSDGTPLVTGERRGDGWLILFHTTADPAWSNLPMSVLFVDMLRRILGMSRGISEKEHDGVLPPLLVLDGFGHAHDATTTSMPILASEFDEAKAGPQTPPGFYGSATARRALNLSAELPQPLPIDHFLAGEERREYGQTSERDLKPWLLAAVALLALADMLLGLHMRGMLPRRAGQSAAAIFLVWGLTVSSMARADDAFTLAAALETRLSYAKTGVDEVDRISHVALKGLSATLRDRTSIEPGDPMGIDVETDELIFFPLIYWPITPEQPALSEKALAKVDHYLTTGGIILFDTRDQRTATGRGRGSGPGELRLRELLAGLNLPPLVPVPPEHVLTRAFYLMHEFPGRWTGGTVWVEHHEGGVNDGVSSLIVGGHDWASAWAIDSYGRPMFAVVPGSESQREMAYRFGINLVMYAMTGNYKADQVHLPAILERLGQ